MKTIAAIFCLEIRAKERNGNSTENRLPAEPRHRHRGLKTALNGLLLVRPGTVQITLALACIFIAHSLSMRADAPTTNVGSAGKDQVRRITPNALIGLPNGTENLVHDGTLNLENAHKILGAIHGCGAPNDRSPYMLINVLLWNANSSGIATLASSNWYIYRGTGGSFSRWSEADFDSNNRIYGAKSTYFLSIQVVPSGYTAQAPTYTYTESKRTPTNIQDLNALVKDLLGGGPVATGPVYFCQKLDRSYPTATLSFAASIPAATSAASNLDHTAQPGQPELSEQPTQPDEPAVQAQGAATPAGTGRKVPPLQPDHGSPAGSSSDGIAKPVTIATYSVIDEAKAWWDVSVAVPISKISDVEYSSTDNTVTPKTVNRQNVFAVVDFFLQKKDLVNFQYSLIPHPLVGVSMASKPLQSLLFAGAIGFNFGEVYLGANLLKEPTLANGLTGGSTATSGQLAAATGKSFQAHFNVGINLSVKAAFAAIKKTTSNSK